MSKSENKKTNLESLKNDISPESSKILQEFIRILRLLEIDDKVLDEALVKLSNRLKK